MLCGDSHPCCPPGKARLLSLTRSFCALRSSKLKLASLHVHFSPAKPHALGLESQPLLHRRVPLQLNRAASPQHPLPRQSESAAQSRRHLPRRARKSSRPRHTAVGRYFSTRYSANRPLDSQTHRATFVWTVFLSARTAPYRPQVVLLRDEPDAPSLPRSVRQRRDL